MTEELKEVVEESEEVKEPIIHKVYIKIDESNRVIDINSDLFITDFTDWIKIDSGVGDKYTHAQVNYLNDVLTTEDGYYKYKYENEKVVKRSEKEIAEDMTENPTLKMRVANLEFTQAEQDDVISDILESQMTGGETDEQSL